MEGKKKQGKNSTMKVGGTNGTAAMYANTSLGVRPWTHNGIIGTKKSLRNYLLYLEDMIEEASGKGAYLTSDQKMKLKSYSSTLKNLLGSVDSLPDDAAPRTRVSQNEKYNNIPIIGSFSVTNAGLDTVKKWHNDLDNHVRDKSGQTWKEQVQFLAAEVRSLYLIVDYYYCLSKEVPAETPTINKSETVTLYRRMWSGEAEKILVKNSVKDGMSGSDSYKKYFTTDKGHTEKFSNASSTDANDEVILEFTVDWDDYWEFVNKYGAPNQKTGSLSDKNSAILNQERIVKGAGANFRVDEQVKKVVSRFEHHNIGVGVGSVEDFDKIVKGRIKLIKL